MESERESFIEQVREVIEMADEKGEGMKEGFPQVCLHYMVYSSNIHTVNFNLNLKTHHLNLISPQMSDLQQQPELSVPMVPGKQPAKHKLHNSQLLNF